MAAKAQIAANRRNAQKSTGPRTAEGKAVVAQNAVKHGPLAREGVLPGKDLEESERHREAANTLARWREEDDQARKARTVASWRPADSSSRPDTRPAADRSLGD